ncbi:unnamed protein product, partial [Amoebophrya sp. A25]|eukprot:GSA25T00011971001.1
MKEIVNAALPLEVDECAGKNMFPASSVPVVPPISSNVQPQASFASSDPQALLKDLSGYPEERPASCQVNPASVPAASSLPSSSSSPIEDLYFRSSNNPFHNDLLHRHVTSAGGDPLHKETTGSLKSYDPESGGEQGNDSEQQESSELGDSH